MMQMLYYVINNVHVDYAALIWEGLHSSLMHPTTNIPYPRFTKIVTDHILTMHPDISKRTNEPYYIVENDKVVKSIFNSGKAKSTKEYETQHAIKKVDEHLLDEDIKKLVEGEEPDANKFVDDMMLSQEDPNTRIDPRSHKESP
ncbi:hypothetical protein Tco_1075842 [Tanacetum coccineum]